MYSTLISARSDLSWVNGVTVNMPERKGKKKEMVITIKSTPKSSSKARPQKSQPRSERRPRDLKRKGTRGGAWIG